MSSSELASTAAPERSWLGRIGVAALCWFDSWAGAERLALGLSDPLDFAPRARWPLDEVAGPQTKPLRVSEQGA